MCCQVAAFIKKVLSEAGDKSFDQASARDKLFC